MADEPELMSVTLRVEPGAVIVAVSGDLADDAGATRERPEDSDDDVARRFGKANLVSME